MLAGLAFVWRQPMLRLLAWTSACWHLVFYGYMALYVLFATRVLGMSPGMMGTAQMLGGVGVLASSVLLKPLTRRFGSGGTVAIGLCASSIGFVLMPAIPRDLFGSSAAGAGLLAERIGVRGGLGVVAAGALLLTLSTLFGTRLHRINE